MAARTLIRSRWLISGDPDIGDIDRGEILIEDGQIVEVANSILADDVELIEAGDMILIPGFVDTHRHTWQSCVRHGCSNIPPLQYFDLFMSRRGPRFRPEDVYLGNLVGALTAIDSGITTMLDWSQVQNSPEHSDAAIDALQESGIRAVFGHGWALQTPGQGPDPMTVGHPDDIRRLRRDRFASDDGLLTLMMAGRGPEIAVDGVWEQDLALARDLNIRSTIHMGAYPVNAGKHAVRRMNDAGLLGPDLTFVHCCHCADDEIRMMADNGVTSSLGVQVESNSQGIGPIPFDRLLAAGIEPSLSCDTETKGAGDMFSVMRAALSYYRTQRPEFRAAGAPENILTSDVLRYATQVGADANGLGHRVGSLTPGKAADLVLIRARDINLAPVTDPVSAIVLAAHPGNVDTVMVGGRILKQDGKLRQPDLVRLLDRAEASRDYIVAGDATDVGLTCQWEPVQPASEAPHD